MEWEIQLQRYIYNILQNEFTGHSVFHSLRVRNLAVKIAVRENADVDIVTACAYLHDVTRADDGSSHALSASKLARDILEHTNFAPGKIENVVKCILHHEWSSRPSQTDINLLENTLGREFLVFVDADRLDAMGAIGIARTFAFGGAHKRPLWVPDNVTAPENHYGRSSLDHFYDQLLQLKDGMYTDTAKAIAIERHCYMEQYIQQFKKEWFGDES